MTARPQPAARFRIAPVAAAGAVWDDALDVLLAPIRLSKPVFVVLPGSRSGGAR